MRTPRKFSSLVNLGALLLFLGAVVALLCTQRLPSSPPSGRAPASAAQSSQIQ